MEDDRGRAQNFDPAQPPSGAQMSSKLESRSVRRHVRWWLHMWRGDTWPTGLRPLAAPAASRPPVATTTHPKIIKIMMLPMSKWVFVCTAPCTTYSCTLWCSPCVTEVSLTAQILGIFPEALVQRVNSAIIHAPLCVYFRTKTKTSVEDSMQLGEGVEDKD